MASLVLGVAGAVVGGIVGGPAGAQIGFALGSAAGGLLFPPKGPDGPRLNELAMQSSAYGKTIPIPYGTDRVAGNVIWADKIQEHEHEEGGKGGPEYTTYSYTCSFASSIVAGPIAGILRIWADGLLIYDRRPTSTGESVGFKAGSHKIYLGTETQLPDPTIQAIIGDTPAYRGQAYIVFTDLELGKFGNRIPSLSFEYVTSGSDVINPASTFGEQASLSYRSSTFHYAADDEGRIWLATNTGHAVQDEEGKWTLDTSINAIPQLHIYDPQTNELLHVIELPHTQIGEYNNQTEGTGRMVYSGGFMFIGHDAPVSNSPSVGLVINTSTYEMRSIHGACLLGGNVYWPGVPVPVIRNNAVYFATSNGASYGMGYGFMPMGHSLDESQYSETPDFSEPEAKWNAPQGFTSQRHEVKQPAVPPYESVDCEIAPTTRLLLPNWAFKVQMIQDGNVAIVQGYENGGTYIAWVGQKTIMAGFNVDAPDDVATGIVPGLQTTAPAIAWDEANMTLWAFGASEEGGANYNTLYAVQRGAADTLNVTPTGFQYEGDGSNVVGMSIDKETGYLRVLRGNGTVYIDTLDPVNGQVVDSYATSVLLSGHGTLIDYPDLGKVIFADGYSLHDIPYTSPLNKNPVNLGAIVADISRRSDLTLADIDVSELTDMVEGYTIGHQMAARSALEPLMQAYFFDPVESDYQIKFRKRGRPAVVTIPDEDLAAHSSGSEPPDLIEIRRKQELDLPQIVNVKYINPAADYQTSTQYEARQTGRSKSAVTVDLPIVMPDEKAKQVAAAALYTAWAERTGLSFATSLAYAKYEPTDCFIVHNRLVRIVHRKRNGGIIEWEGYADGNTIYPSETVNQGGAAAPAGPVDQAIVTTPPTRVELMDTPMLPNTDGSPGFVVAAQGTNTGWTGAQIFKSIDGGVSYQPLVGVPSASIMGMAVNALGNYAGGDTFDELNTVTIRLPTSSPVSTLASATELAVLNGANAALLGDELIQYKRTVLNDDGTVTLSGLLRYRRGTDYAVHTAGERFVALGNGAVQVPVSTSEIGLPRQYKAVSNGSTLASAQAVTLTYTGADLKPYSPVHIGGWRNADGDLALSWVRRTRIGGEWRDGVEVPLSESVEAYDVEILNGAGAVVRTFSGVASPALTYTAAEQVADFGAPQASITARVYQLSSIVGRGFPGTGSV